MATAPSPKQPRRPMLIDINLAPVEVRRPLISISMFSLTLVILALVGGYLLFPFTTLAQLYRWPEIPNLHQVVTAWRDYVADQQTTLSDRQAELDRLKSLAGQAADLRSQIVELESLLDAMEQDYPVFSLGVVEWSTVLREIGQAATSSGVTILSITQGSEVSIEGIADSVDDVINYRNALRNTGLFSNAVAQWEYVPPASPTPAPTPAPTPTPTPTPMPEPPYWTFVITVTLLGGGQ